MLGGHSGGSKLPVPSSGEALKNLPREHKPRDKKEAADPSYMSAQTLAFLKPEHFKFGDFRFLMGFSHTQCCVTLTIVNLRSLQSCHWATWLSLETD